jgi:folate-binding protein YgfZ
VILKVDLENLTAASELGDFEAEYRALVDTCGLAARSDRGCVVVSGDRRDEMLNGLVSNQVAGLSDVGRHAFLLTAKGRVLTDLRVFPRAGDTLLDVPRSGLPNLLATFKKYLPPIYATFEDVSEAVTQLAVYGPEAATAVQDALGLEPPTEHLATSGHDLDGRQVLVIRNRWLGSDGLEFIAPADAARALAEHLSKAVGAAGGRPVGARALEVVRIESGLALYGVDISDDNLAQETGLEGEAISYDKGCYLGQEVVARVHFRGHVNRRLRGLEFDADGAVPGSALSLAGKDIGQVTSVANSPDLGPIGLGYVRREVEPPASVRWSEGGVSGDARILELPLRRPAV